MDQKRTKQIAVRITEDVDKTLEEEAKKHRWTKAALANMILEEWTTNQQKEHKDGSGNENL